MQLLTLWEKRSVEYLNGKYSAKRKILSTIKWLLNNYFSDRDEELLVQQHNAEWSLYNSLAFMTPALFADCILGTVSKRRITVDIVEASHYGMW